MKTNKKGSQQTPFFIFSLQNIPPDDNVDSKPLALYKKIAYNTVYPVINFVRGYVDFLKEHSL